MERIKEALNKAGEVRTAPERPAADNRFGTLLKPVGSAARGWTVPKVDPDPGLLERNRIVSHDKTDPSHMAFDILRTKAFYAMQEHGWSSLAVCSPTAGCGKTSVAMNLAFSMARQHTCRTVLIDFDLRNPSVEQMLGARSAKSLGHYIEDSCALEDCFVGVGDNLFFGLNSYRVRNSAEMMRHQRVRDILPAVQHNLDPTIVIFDLPPMLASDDAIAFLPQVDCAVLIVESGKTTAKQIEECQQQFKGTEFLGIVLNKCPEPADDSYAYKYR